MKPPPFDLARPTSLDEALDVLYRAADPRVLAGGQSLLQDLRRRRVAPSVLVDVGGLPELAGVSADATEVRIGARVRHVDLERGAVSPHDGPLGALLAETAGWIAHPPIRSRGTLAGTLAWAHPAAEWCAVAVGLGGHVELASVRGRRRLPVAQFLLGPGRTALAADELVTAVLLPRTAPGTRAGVAEHRRTHASFAEVAVVAARAPDGATRLGLAGVAPTAVGVTGPADLDPAAGVARALTGADKDRRRVAQVLTTRLVSRLDGEEAA